MKRIIKLSLFVILAELLGLIVSSVLIEDYTNNPYIQIFIIESSELSGFKNQLLTILFMVCSIIIGAVIFIEIIKKYKSKITFILIEFASIGAPLSIFYYSFFRIVGFGYLDGMIIGILLGIFSLMLKWKYNKLKNYIVIFASASVGALVGLSLSPFFIILFLIILSIYDYISVFKTKHMVKIATIVISKKLAFNLTSKTKDNEKELELGAGDVIAPIMLGVSFFGVDVLASLITFLGSILALFIMYFYIYKNRNKQHNGKRKIVPALPFITSGMLLLLFISFIFRFIN